MLENVSRVLCVVSLIKMSATLLPGSLDQTIMIRAVEKVYR